MPDKGRQMHPAAIEANRETLPLRAGVMFRISRTQNRQNLSRELAAQSRTAIERSRQRLRKVSAPTR